MPKLWKDLVLAKKTVNKKNLVHVIVILFIIVNVLGLKDYALRDWDEGTFALQAQWLASTGQQGKPFNFQTPPLYQTLIAIPFFLFQPNDILLPLLSIVFSCITLYLIFYHTKSLFSDEEAIYSIILFASTEFFLFFSKSGLSDATFLCFFIASILFFIRGLKSNKTTDFLIAGLFTTCAFYTKYSAFPLVVIFLVIGVMNRKTINKRWFILSIIVPILLYLPYLYIFIRFVQIPGITARHAGLLSINHMKFLVYILTYAPVPFILTLFYVIFNLRRFDRISVYLLIFVVIFFFIVGFYYPYFRLVYPLAPLFSIIAARFIKGAKKYRYYIIAVSIIISLILGFKTLIYNNKVPKDIGSMVGHYATRENIKYIYTVVPPNIDFYVDGSIVIPEGHQWLAIGNKFPIFLKNRKIIYREENELLEEEKILLIHATTFDTIKYNNPSLYDLGARLVSIEFIDAPVYYKDIYNPERLVKQIYELYVFETEKLGKAIDDLWTLGFNRKIHVIYLDIQQ